MQFRDLPRQYEALKPQIDAAMTHVASSAHFISGPEVKELEKACEDNAENIKDLVAQIVPTYHPAAG